MTKAPSLLRASGLALSAWFAALAAAALAQTAPAPIAGQGYRLVQDWTFGSSVSSPGQLASHFHTRFIYGQGRLDKLNDEWQRYRDNANHEFGNGRFALVARAPAGLTKGLIESGMLRSRWNGQYGYIEGRMKVPSGRGLWVAFWLNPQDQRWPPEIDIVEIVDNGNDGRTQTSFHFLHGAGAHGQAPQGSPFDQREAYRPGFDYAQGFHNFAVLWQPGRVRHYVDEKIVADRRFPWTHDDGADAGPAHVLVTLAVGGRWPGAPQHLEDFPARLEIEYIRVWQQ